MAAAVIYFLLKRTISFSHERSEICAKFGNFTKILDVAGFQQICVNLMQWSQIDYMGLISHRRTKKQRNHYFVNKISIDTERRAVSL